MVTSVLTKFYLIFDTVSERKYLFLYALKLHQSKIFRGYNSFRSSVRRQIFPLFSFVQMYCELYIAHLNKGQTLKLTINTKVIQKKEKEYE